VTIFWRQLSENVSHFNGGTSDTLDVLKRVFGSQIRKSDVRTLEAMAVSASDEFYAEVADIVRRNGDIEIWGEY